MTEPLSASTALDAFSSQGHSLLLQQFIETAEKDKNKHDFRAVVIDGKVVAAIRRNSIDTDFRTNASLKDNSEAAELDSEMTAIAIKAAAAVGLACAGVDIAKDINTGEVYVYEVNGNFDFKSTEKHSKKNVAAAIAEYALKLAKGDKAADTVKQAEPSFDVAQLSEDTGIPFLKFPADLEDEDTEMEFGSMVTPLKGFNDWSKMGEMLADDSRLTKQIFDKMAKKGKPLNSWELKALKLSK